MRITLQNRPHRTIHMLGVSLNRAVRRQHHHSARLQVDVSHLRVLDQLTGLLRVSLPGHPVMLIVTMQFSQSFLIVGVNRTIHSPQLGVRLPLLRLHTESRPKIPQVLLRYILVPDAVQ